MESETIFTETLDVADPEGFAEAPEQSAMQILQRLYEQRCWQGVFVLEILEVVRLGNVRFVRGLSANAAVSVRFRARVTRVSVGDIVGPLTVSRTTPFVVVQGPADTKILANVLPNDPPGAEALALEQVIFARVCLANYSPMQPQATAVCKLLTCETAAPALEVEGSLTPEVAEELWPLVERGRKLLDERETISETGKQTVWLIEQLLYSYRVPDSGKDSDETRVPVEDASDWVGPPTLAEVSDKTTNLLDFVAAARTGPGADVSGAWDRPLTIPRSAPLARRGAASGAGAGAVTPREAFSEMLRSVNNYLSVVNRMAETYTPEMLESHQAIWAIMRKAQLPLPESVTVTK